MSTIIKVRCTDQVLTFENTPVIASGGLEEDFIVFDFCSKWDGFVKTAVFWRNEKEGYHVMLDDGDSCAIPQEVLADEGVIYFGVFGVNGTNTRRTTEALSYRIVKGAITTGTKPASPAPDIYTQLLNGYAELRVDLTKIQNGIIAFSNVMVSFIDGVAVFEHPSIVPSSVCFVQRRAATPGLTNEYAFATTSGPERVTIVMDAVITVNMELNIIVFNL